MKKVILMIFLLMIVIGCSKEVPPGYKLMCSVDGWAVTIKFPNGHLSINTWWTKWGAASYARSWEKNKGKKIISDSDKYEWEECL
jgi:hypothetical protein